MVDDWPRRTLFPTDLENSGMILERFWNDSGAILTVLEQTVARGPSALLRGGGRGCAPSCSYACGAYRSSDGLEDDAEGDREHLLATEAGGG